MNEMSPGLTWVVAIATIVVLVLTCWKIRSWLAQKHQEQDKNARVD
jgi:flagellar basal body-associated protein FliL